MSWPGGRCSAKKARSISSCMSARIISAADRGAAVHRSLGRDRHDANLCASSWLGRSPSCSAASIRIFSKRRAISARVSGGTPQDHPAAQLAGRRRRVDFRLASWCWANLPPRRAVGTQGQHARQHHRHPGRLPQMGVRLRGWRHSDHPHGRCRSRVFSSSSTSSRSSESRWRHVPQAHPCGLRRPFLLFLYGPFIVLGILSFQKGPDGGPQFPIEEWSTYWYRAHLRSDAAFAHLAAADRGISLVRSLTLAFMTMVASTVLGVMAAQAFRAQFSGAAASSSISSCSA